MTFGGKDFTLFLENQFIKFRTVSTASDMTKLLYTKQFTTLPWASASALPMPAGAHVTAIGDG